MKKIGHFINAKHIISEHQHTSNIYNPATGEITAKLMLADKSDLNLAIESAKSAQPKWANLPPQKRARIFMRFIDLLHQNMDELAQTLSSEHGKTIEDSKGDIIRGLEVCEFVCGIAHLQKGEFSQNVGPSIDLFSQRHPVGIGAGITPFNFPAMIPMWMFAPAIAAGNAFILKPSERDPSVPIRLAELMIEAGLPAGVLNVINGDKHSVDNILTSPDISAISFVGSTPIAKYVYAKAAEHSKRVQCFGGAKNHMIIMPDADMEQAVDALIGAGYGSAGERCMAVSVAVPVGRQTGDLLVEKLKARIAKLNIGPYHDPLNDFGPLVTSDAKKRVTDLVEQGIREGAELVVDGRNFSLQGYENGFFVGPCLFDHVSHEMCLYRQEIFGPVLSVMRAKDYDEAVSYPMNHQYGNGVAIYTRDGDTARDFANRINIGMVGINVPIPVPLAYYTFGGWKDSAFGDLNQHGQDSIRFWTRTKTITARWPSGIRQGAEFTIPVMK
ncbi:MAG: CoA-acylating methylmalonate-semialdehyde dehydrogenase [Pseudomonadota bacterium]